LVTGIGGGGHGEQILKALKLGSIKYLIVGADANAQCANRHEVDHFAVLPLARDPTYLDHVVLLAQRFSCRALFHGSEAEMMVFSHAREVLSGKGIYVPVNPPSVMDICQDKAKTMEFLAARGIKVPAFREVRRIADCADYNVFPAVIKPSAGGGSANVFIVQTKDELRLFSEYLLRICDRFVIQEYVGSAEEEFTVGVLFGADGELINSIAVKRVVNNALTIRTSVPNRSGRRDLGDRLVISTGISQGHVADWKEIRSQCEKIACLLQPRAPVNIQCRFVKGNVIPFEINPRFSGTTSLRALAGYNEPDILVRRDVLGEKIKPNFSYQEVLILRGLKENVVAA
jgi:carbamoyl-phosphate synthase large subunit